MTHFSVFSQVSNLGCIEFLNRVPQVRFLPGALPKTQGQLPFSIAVECPFRVAVPRLSRICPAADM